jgi:isopentenyldiphosphate isomerase
MDGSAILITFKSEYLIDKVLQLKKTSLSHLSEKYKKVHFSFSTYVTLENNRILLQYSISGSVSRNR